MVFKSIIGATLMLILSTTAMADWKAVSGNERNLYWLLEKETGKLLITRSDRGTTQECLHNLGQSGSNSYDIIEGFGRPSSVLVINTIDARYVPCESRGQEATNCSCGQEATFHQGRQQVPSAPIPSAPTIIQ
jgi:hypothetical protein